MLKKMTAVAGLTVLLVTSTMFWTGCKSNTDSAGNTADKRRIILLTNGDDPFWDAMREGMNAASKELDLASANLEAVLDKGDFSDEAQINKLNQYATQTGIAAVAISSVDAKNLGIADAMKALRAKGVHVITVDSDMSDPATRFAYLGTNNVEGGQELGKAARGLQPDGGVYATFVGLKTVANAIERIGGFKQGAGEKFEEADSLEDKGDEDQAQENVKSVLNNRADLNTLVGIWSYNAHAIVNVVAERKIRDKVKVVVFDAAPAALDDMSNGMIDAMIVQNPYQMGYLGTKLMKALIEDDGQAIKALYPDYDPATTAFSNPGGDILTTELRVVVPSASSPLSKEMFNATTQFFTYEEFRAWMSERNLKGS